MQVELAFIYLAIWLLMLWLGGISLQATGMERSKAHFQALSALSGTGFTTRDAESVVNHSLTTYSAGTCRPPGKARR